MPDSSPAHAKWDRWLPAILFLFFALLLGWNASPTVSFHDSGEFSLAAASFGLPHPPGAPTWTLAAALAVRLMPFLEPAHVTNLLSAFYGAGALALLYALTRRWLGSSELSESAWWLALIAPFTMLGSAAFLEQALLTEQYTLLVLIFLTCLLIIEQEKESESTTWWKWGALGVLSGLGIGNHLSQIVLIFLFIAGALVCGRKGSSGRIGVSFAGLIGGLSIFLYLPIAASRNPIINWGRPNNWENFVWCITRQQWETRELSAAPEGFIGEWMWSYDLWHQLGPVALVLAICGTLVLLMRQSWRFLLLAISIGPYLVGMLLGHLKQSGMDLLYIRFYGVADWHLPLYFGFAAAAALGMAFLASRLPEKYRTVSGGAALFVIAAGSFVSLAQNSMRDYRDAEVFIMKLLAPLKERAVLTTASDNLSHNLGYLHYSKGFRRDIWYAYAFPQRAGVTNQGFAWSLEAAQLFLDTDAYALRYQPLNPPRIPAQDFIDRPFYVEFSEGNNPSSLWMLPAGHVFQLLSRPTTDGEVRAAEAALKRDFPATFAKPDRVYHRLTATAYCELHQRRALFFLARGLNDLALESAELALTWSPENPNAWFISGLAAQNGGQPDAAEKAYRQAIDIMPYLSGPRTNLALILIEKGELDEAERLLRAELPLERSQRAAQPVLDRLAQERISSSR